jgi:hypothetical protein
VNRRAFLGAVGATVSVGLLGRRAFATEDPLVVRVWPSTRAAEHEPVGRLRGYLVAALEPVVGPVAVQRGEGSVDLPREGGRQVLSRRWPRRVLLGASGFGQINPVDGVNLLVTDGDPTVQPAGFARPGVAAATGASAVARMPPVDEIDPVVPYSIPAAATQLALHECGHALGFTHEQGSVTESEGGIVSSPMVGSYYWARPAVRDRQLDGAENACGESYPAPNLGGKRRLRLRYADCVTDRHQ